MNAPVIHAFGGGQLDGGKLVRFVFVDEGGISQHEPFVVCAGVFVHGDDQLIPLEEALARLVHKHIPAEDQSGFIFHAKNIWSGTGIFKDRGKWPLDRRLRILHDLARIPRKLCIPIIYESVERARISEIETAVAAKRSSHQPTIHEISVSAHALALAACTLRIDECMRAKWHTEVAQMVVEDNDQVRSLAKGVHELLRDPSKVDGPIIPNTRLPLRKIRGSVHFASKTESSPLQLADLCAFLIRGHLAGHPHNAPLYNRLTSMILNLPQPKSNPLISVRPPYAAS